MSQLRYRFLTERTSFVDFDRRDVDRVKSDDAYLRRFILHRKRNVADACELLVVVLLVTLACMECWKCVHVVCHVLLFPGDVFEMEEDILRQW